MKVIITIFFIIFNCVYSQINYGSITTEYGYNSYNTKGELSQIGDLVECDNYFANDGFSHQLSLGYRFNIFKKIYILPNIQYSFLSNYYFNRFDTFSSRNDISLFVEDVNTESRVDVKSHFLSPSLNFSFNMISLKENKYNLELLAGLFYRMYFAKTFQQYEQIKSPSNANFINHDNKQKREINSGDVNFLNNQIFYSAGIQYRHKLEKFTLNIGTMFSFSNNFLILNDQINNSELKWFVGLEYSIIKKEEEQETIIPPPIPKLPEPTYVEEKEEIAVKDSFLLNISNDIYKDLIIKQKEEVLASTPLVNSIFFEQNSSEIPDNYVIDDVFDSSYLDNTIKAHSVVFPRIVKILKENETSKINLVAYHLPNKENKNIIEERLINLKKYLNLYGITSDRIGNEIRNINENQYDSPEVIEEFYRVDLDLLGAETQKYVKISKYKELNGIIEFDVDYAPDKTANLYLSLNDKLITNVKKGKSEVEVQTKIKEDDLSFYSKLSGSQSEKIFYFNIDEAKLKVIDEALDYENFEAILRFDFNSAELSFENKQLLIQLYDMLPKNVGVMILGSADDIGDSKVNAKLEIERANNTKTFLEQINKKKLEIKTGRTNEKFPNDTPQGRFLNRSIRIRLIVEE